MKRYIALFGLIFLAGTSKSELSVEDAMYTYCLTDYFGGRLENQAYIRFMACVVYEWYRLYNTPPDKIISIHAYMLSEHNNTYIGPIHCNDVDIKNICSVMKTIDYSKITGYKSIGTNEMRFVLEIDTQNPKERFIHVFSGDIVDMADKGIIKNNNHAINIMNKNIKVVRQHSINGKPCSDCTNNEDPQYYHESMIDIKFKALPPLITNPQK